MLSNFLGVTWFPLCFLIGRSPACFVSAYHSRPSPSLPPVHSWPTLYNSVCLLSSLYHCQSTLRGLDCWWGVRERELSGVAGLAVFWAVHDVLGAAPAYLGKLWPCCLGFFFSFVFRRLSILLFLIFILTTFPLVVFIILSRDGNMAIARWNRGGNSFCLANGSQCNHFGKPYLKLKFLPLAYFDPFNWKLHHGPSLCFL